MGKSRDFDSAKSPSRIDTGKRIMGPKKTAAPKRIVGQYFLDLGQSDFSYSTCPTCGLFYARGQDNDEKVHKTFHRNRTQGILFKGWQSERVASKIDHKDNRVIVVLPEDTHHQTKVKEVIDVMEVELGLTPGWLLQRPCKVYLFISSSRKIVGCLMAESIKTAFRVVPVEFNSSGAGGGSFQCDKLDKKLSIPSSELSKGSQDKHCDRLDRSVSELQATGKGEIDNRKGSFMETEHVPLNQKSGLTVAPKEVPLPASLPARDVCVNTRRSPERISEAKVEVLPLPSDRVKQEPASVKDKLKSPKITDFFAVKFPRVRKETDAKSQWDVSDSKLDVKPIYLKEECDWKLDIKPTYRKESDSKLDVKCLSLKEESNSKLDVKFTYLKEEMDIKLETNARNLERDRQPRCVQVKEEDGFLSHMGIPLSEGADQCKVQGSSDGNVTVQEADSKQDGKHTSNVMLFGKVKFSREITPRKRVHQEQAQDLGGAILCTKTSVPAVCGVRIIWVSQSERRKGIASHLLDAMRKTFCFGVILEPSQFAFSQPTPEGRKFAARYCKTREFLVYTSS